MKRRDLLKIFGWAPVALAIPKGFADAAIKEAVAKPVLVPVTADVVTVPCVSFTVSSEGGFIVSSDMDDEITREILAVSVFR